MNALSPTVPPALAVAFDREGRQLFGWYHPPARNDGHTRNCAVVLCNPLGYDAICTHRHYRVLAQLLAQAGFAVLRFDHHGTGDSSGSDEDPQRLSAWLNGIARATEFARQCSGATHISLIGVRMGGTLALAAASQTPVASVVAWSPFASGTQYLREMRALRMMRDAEGGGATITPDAGADPGEETAGYLLSASTIAALATLSPVTTTQPPAPDVLLLARDDLPESEKLGRHLGKIGSRVTALKVAGYADMMRDTFDSVVPTEALHTIRDWLLSKHAAVASTEMPLPTPSAGITVGSRSSDSGVCERPVHFGPGGALFGILSTPLQSKARRASVGVLFITVGSNLHIGPNRMYVTQARAMAAMGFTALRMDIGGVGESPPSAGRQENQLYAIHSTEDVAAAIRFLKEQHGVDHIVLIGVCSGAYLSFHTALSQPLTAAVVLINPQTFHWREGDSLKLRSHNGIRAIGFYRSQLFKLDTLRRMFTGQVNFRIIVLGVLGMVKKRLALRLAGWVSTDNHTDSPAAIRSRIAGAFRDLLKRGTNVYLIYSANDGGINEMETYLGPNAASVRNKPGFKLQIVDGADHTFTPLWAQRRLLDLLTQHLLRQYG